MWSPSAVTRTEARMRPKASSTVESIRPEQKTLVDDSERFSVPLIPAAPRNRILLTVLTGPERGAVYRLPGDSGTLGRSEQADATIADPGLSRVHARILRMAEGYVIEDAGSTNGTYVDGQRIAGPVPLTPGARFQLGRRTVIKFNLHDELEEAAALSVHRAALNDRLTGVYNRGVFDDRLEAEFAFAIRHETPLTLLMVDIDHFKSFNDTYGHQTGDAVLSVVAKHLRETVRAEDVLARYGGEEFGVIARSLRASKALVLGERIRRAVAEIRLPWGAETLSITASVGAATLDGSKSGWSSERLVAAADAALYEAKRRGRNSVVHAGDMV